MGSLTTQPGPGVPRRLNFQDTLLYHKMLSPVSWAWTDSDFPMIMFCPEWTLLRRGLLLQPGFFFFFFLMLFSKKLEAGPQLSLGALQKPRPSELLGSCAVVHSSLISRPQALLFEWITAFLY